jgi:hypothetical protein
MSHLFTELPVQAPPPPPSAEDFPDTPSFVRQPVPKTVVEQMSAPIQVIDPEAYRKQLGRRLRRCISRISASCPGQFLSDHAGHRICDDCSQSEAFRGFSEFSACGF